MKTRRFVAFLLVMITATAFAQQGFDTPPPPAPAQPLLMPVFGEARLANGLGVAVAERHVVPLVTVILQVQAGSLLDPPGKSGLASLAFTLMGKGAVRKGQSVDATGLAAAAEALGGSLETGAGAQAGRIAMTVAVNRLDEAVALLADVARAPTFPAEELERSRAQSLDAIKLSLSDPGTLAALVGQRLFWGEVPNGAVTTPASLARLRREDVLLFHRQQLRPERSSLVFAGDVDLKQAQALAEKHFGSWKSNRMAAPAPKPAAPQPLAPPAVLLDLPGAGQSAVLLLAPYPGQGNEPAQRALLRAGAVANGVLGVGYSSRLNQEVRIKRGLSYGASSGAEVQPGGGMLSAFAQTKHASAAEVAGLLRAELARLSSEDVLAPELAARQAVLVGDFGRQLETTASLAATVAEQLARGRVPADLARLPEEILAVDAARVRGFASQHWAAPQGQRLVVVGDLKAGKLDAAQFPGAWVIPAAELDLGSATLRRARGK